MAWALLQIRDKVPWKLEPFPPHTSRPTRTRPFGGGGPLFGPARRGAFFSTGSDVRAGRPVGEPEPPAQPGTG